MLEIIPLLSLGLNVLIMIVSVAGFVKIIKNDLTHVQNSLSKIESNVEDINCKVASTAERVATIEGKLCLLGSKRSRDKKSR